MQDATGQTSVSSPGAASSGMGRFRRGGGASPAVMDGGSGVFFLRNTSSSCRCTGVNADIRSERLTNSS